MNIIEKDYNWAHELSARQVTNLIILHHAAAKSCTAADVHNWHLNRGWAGIGYHFFYRQGWQRHAWPSALGSRARTPKAATGALSACASRAITRLRRRCPPRSCRPGVSWCSISRLSWAWIVWLATATLQWRGRAARPVFPVRCDLCDGQQH